MWSFRIHRAPIDRVLSLQIDPEWLSERCRELPIGPTKDTGSHSDPSGRTPSIPRVDSSEEALLLLTLGAAIVVIGGLFYIAKGSGGGNYETKITVCPAEFPFYKRV